MSILAGKTSRFYPRTYISVNYLTRISLTSLSFFPLLTTLFGKSAILSYDHQTAFVITIITRGVRLKYHVINARDR